MRDREPVGGEELISVIVPVYKVEPWLRECLDSILAQTYEKLEILLVDDGSPDNCGAICDEYARRDGRITVIHQENRGLSAARNAGIARSHGAWLGFIDSDDYILPEMFERMHREGVEADSQIVVCGIHQFGDVNTDLRFPGGRFDTREAMYRLLTRGLLTSNACNKLFRREIFEGIPFPEGELYEDMLIMHKLFLRAERVSILEDLFYNYRIHEGSIMDASRGRNARNRIRSRERRCEDLRDTEFYPRARICVLNLLRDALIYMVENDDIDPDLYRELSAKGRDIVRGQGHVLNRGQRVRYFLFMCSPKRYLGLKALAGRKS